MTWPEAFGILFGLIGMAFLFNGFPNITIGGSHWTTNNYQTEEDESA